MKGFFCAIGMLLLILDSGTAIAGAAEGISLCIRSVIPSLFPFFFLSNVLIGSISQVSFPFLHCIAKLCGIPSGMESILIPAFLGGYPVGAQCIAQHYRSGYLQEQDARHLLSFCSNAGPSFIFGVVAPQFSSPYIGLLLWLIHIISALLVGILFTSKCDRIGKIRHASAPQRSALHQSLFSIGQVCGWVILFRIVIVFLDKWLLHFLPVQIQVILSGMMELTNGCLILSEIPSEEMRFIIASVFLSLGGLCVTMQTATVTEGLYIGSYIKGKLLQAMISGIFSILVIHRALPVLILIIISIYIFKIRSRNLSAVGV